MKLKLKEIDFKSINMLKFGNEVQISGIIFANGKESMLVPFEDVDLSKLKITLVESDKHDWRRLLFQLDNLEAIIKYKDDNGKLQKIIVRKSHRQVDSKVAWNVFKRDNYTCRYCGKDDVPLTVDHIIRWENMGQTVEDNLISSCKKCNNTRADMPMNEWLISDYYLERVPVKFIDMNLKALDVAFELPLREYKRNR